MQSIHTRGGKIPTQIIVQRLNCRGAVHIERGEYDRAIEILVRALRIWETISEDERYSCCSIDECILKGRKNTVSAKSMFNRNEATVLSGDGDTGMQREGRFIYRQPIMTTRRYNSNKTNDVPSATLPMIITLNMAMANHLSALEKGLCRRRLQKCLRLYGLAHQLQQDAGISSPQATMIISNNVGEIHRITNNQKKYKMCLNHLLSTMMFVVDKNQEFESLQAQTQYTTITSIEEWDGFLRNTSELILHKNCAEAA